MKFHDRRDAGRTLAGRLTDKDLTDPIVLALPRGGVPVAFEIAQRLNLPMEVFVVRKVGAPGHSEFAMGAIAEGGSGILDERVASRLGLSAEQLLSIMAAEQLEVERRVKEYRGDRPLPAIIDRDVILVDDGLATGATAEAALRSLRHHHPRRLILAAPVCAGQTINRLSAIADEVICAETPPSFFAVAQWYEDFSQTTDDDVHRLMAKVVRGSLRCHERGIAE